MPSGPSFLLSPILCCLYSQVPCRAIWQLQAYVFISIIPSKIGHITLFQEPHWVLLLLTGSYACFWTSHCDQRMRCCDWPGLSLVPTPMAVIGSLEAECQEGNGSPEENWDTVTRGWMDSGDKSDGSPQGDESLRTQLRPMAYHLQDPFSIVLVPFWHGHLNLCTPFLPCPFLKQKVTTSEPLPASFLLGYQELCV